MKNSLVLRLLACCVILSLRCSHVISQDGNSKDNPWIELKAIPGSQKVLKTPDYPLSYPRSRMLNWSIEAPDGYRVQLQFIDFVMNTYHGVDPLNCSDDKNDRLLISRTNDFESGYLIGKYCGSNLPPRAMTWYSNMYLQFKSSNLYFDRRGKGFVLRYSAVKRDQDYHPCYPETFQSIPSINLNSSANYQEIKSPFYPTKYPSGMRCDWHITASSKNKIIELKLSEVKIFSYGIDAHTRCENIYDQTKKDDLTIRDSNGILKAVCTPSNSTTTIIYYGQHLTIEFRSNLDNYFLGNTARFRLEYREIDKSSVNRECSSEYRYQPMYHSASSHTQYIESPCYPYQYPSNDRALWYIFASSTSNRIKLTLSDVSIYNKDSVSCKAGSKNTDILVIRTGKLWDVVKTFCSPLDKSLTIESTDERFEIEFKSNNDDDFTGRPPRFKLAYREYHYVNYVGMAVGITIAVVVVVGIAIYCAWKRIRNRNFQRVPAAASQTPMEEAPLTETATSDLPAGGHKQVPANDPVSENPPPSYPGLPDEPLLSTAPQNTQNQGPQTSQSPSAECPSHKNPEIQDPDAADSLKVFI